MLSLQQLLRVWTSCPSQIRDILVQSMCSDFTHSKIFKYRVEAAGSGAILGHVTKLELQTWLKTHHLFLGHGGTNITTIDQIPPTFQDPIVAMKIVFRGEFYKVLEGYTDIILCVVWSPDGKALVGVPFNINTTTNPIVLWNTENGKSTHTLHGHLKIVTSVAWNPDGQTLASGSHDGTIKLWSKTRGGFSVRTTKLGGEVTCVAWSPDGQTLASASHDTTIKLWNKNGELLTTLEGHIQCVKSVAWSPDGTTLASGSYDKTIKLWSKDGDGFSVQTLEGHTNWVMCVAWSPDGQTLASGSRDRTILLWDKHNKPITIQNACLSLWVTCIAWSPDDKTFASVANDKTIKLWNRNGELIKTLELSNPTRWIAWNFNGSILASGMHNGTIKLWT